MKRQIIPDPCKRQRYATMQPILDVRTLTPRTLVMSGFAETDPRFNAKGNGDNHDGVLSPDKFDLVTNSRYANYCQNVLHEFHNRPISSDANSGGNQVDVNIDAEPKAEPSAE